VLAVVLAIVSAVLVRRADRSGLDLA